MKVSGIVFLVLLLGMFGTPAIADPAAEAQETNVEAVEVVAEAVAEATGDAVEATEAEAPAQPESPLTIMDEPLDGTSIETFTAGLEKIDGEVSEQEYRRLMSALDFLLFYDIGAKRDKATLYSRLNGSTPNQILERVGNTRSKYKNNRR